MVHALQVEGKPSAKGLDEPLLAGHGEVGLRRQMARCFIYILLGTCLHCVAFFLSSLCVFFLSHVPLSRLGQV